MKRLAVVVELVLVLFGILTMAVTIATSDYCVVPDNSSNATYNFSSRCCNSSNTLSYYVDRSSEYFRSNSSFYFCPGQHILHSTNSSIIQIVNISNLSLVGGCCDDYCIENASWTVQCKENSGFLFKNVNNLSLVSLAFHGCGQSVPLLNQNRDSIHKKIALALQTVSHLMIRYVTIYNSSGFGVYGENLIGRCLLEKSNFTSSLSTPTSSGNAAFTFRDCGGGETFINITASSFSNGENQSNNNSEPPRATGLSLIIECDNINVLMNNVTLRNNTGYIGGNLAITIDNPTLNNISIKLRNCCIENGDAFKGGGMYINIHRIVPCKHKRYVLFEINNTHFLNNHVQGFGGGLYISDSEVTNWTHNATVVILIFNCSFIENEITSKYHAGIAAHVSNFIVLGIMQSLRPQFQTYFRDCLFMNNTIIRNEAISPAAAVLVEDDPYITIDNCNFTNNKCTGLTAINSNLEFRGNITFKGNHGLNGGGLLVCEGSFVYLDESTQVYFIENHARVYGGGIYIEEKCQQSTPICFYQFSNPSHGYENTDLERPQNRKIHLINNTARKAGHAIFGGSVSHCYLLKSSQPPVTSSIMEIFNKTFYIDPNYPENLTAVSSYPVGICFCTEDELHVIPNCSQRTQTEFLYPGKQFQLHLVIVGQRSNSSSSYGTVGGKFRAGIDGGRHSVYTVDSTSCVTRKFTEKFNTSVNFTLETAFTVSEETKVQQLNVSIHCLPCPPGFTLNGKSCECLELLDSNNTITCDSSTGVIRKRGKLQPYQQAWIGVYCTDNCSGIMYLSHCPFDYCDTSSETKIHVTNITRNSCTYKHTVHTRIPELCRNYSHTEQCANDRTGILCSECKKDYSLILGSSKCRRCGNGPLTLLVVFMIAGIMLVFFLTICNLTVTEGTINGLIFYANIIHINGAAFIVHENNRPASFTYRRYYSFLFAVISWFNLDLGIETCFFDGMDAYWKNGLQFVFPTYLCILAGLVILLSNRYTAVARLFGKNAVKVLATLFVLTHAKLQRAIMSALSFVTITLASDNQHKIFRIVWVLEAKTRYLWGKHCYLFATAAVVSVPVLFFILALLFVQLLQKQSHRRVLCWVNRLKPLLDAFTGPYKDRYSFWIGYLILMRTLLFCGYALNLFRDPNVNLLLAVFACFILLATALSLNGVYKHWPLNVLESFYLLNLGSLCAGVAYIRQADVKEKHLLDFVTTLVSTTLVVFIGVLAYHINKRIQIHKIIRKASNYIAMIRARRRQDDEDNLPPLREECSDEYRPLLQMESSSSSADVLTQ